MLSRHPVVIEDNPVLHQQEAERLSRLAQRLDSEQRHCVELEAQIARAKRKEARGRRLFGSAGGGFGSDLVEIKATLSQDHQNLPTTQTAEQCPKEKKRDHPNKSRWSTPGVPSLRWPAPAPITAGEVVSRNSGAAKAPLDQLYQFGDDGLPKCMRATSNRASGVAHREAATQRQTQRQRKPKGQGAEYDWRGHRVVRSGKQKGSVTSRPSRRTRRDKNQSHSSSASRKTIPLEVRLNASAKAKPQPTSDGSPLLFRGAPLDEEFWTMVFHELDADADEFISAADLAKFMSVSAIAPEGTTLLPPAKQRAAELRTILAKTLRCRDPYRRGVRKLFPSLDSFGNGTISKEHFLAVVMGAEVNVMHRARVAAVVQAEATPPPSANPEQLKKPTGGQTSDSKSPYLGVDNETRESLEFSNAPDTIRKRELARSRTLHKPLSIWQRSRLGDQLAFRRSVLAAIFMAMDRSGCGTVTAEDLQLFLADCSSEHKYLRQQFRRLTQGADSAWTATFNQCFSPSQLHHPMTRSAFIKRFSAPSLSAPGGPQREARFTGGEGTLSIHEKLQRIFDHYARQRAWQDVSQMESSAWLHLLLDADRCHSSPELLFDNEHVAPADADIIYAAAAEREAARCSRQQNVKREDAVSMGKQSYASSGRGRFSFEAFLVALKMVFARRFGHKLQAQPSEQRQYQTVTLLRHCLEVYVLPLFETTCAHRQHKTPVKRVFGDDELQPDTSPDDHLRYRPALQNVVSKFRSGFVQDDGALSFLRRHEAALRVIFSHFAASRVDAMTATTAARTRAQSRLDLGMGGKVTSQHDERREAWKGLKQQVCPPPSCPQRSQVAVLQSLLYCYCFVDIKTQLGGMPRLCKLFWSFAIC